MKTLFALIMMQLKDKLDISGKSLKAYIYKVVFTILKFVVLTAVIYFFFYFLEVMGWLSLNKEIPGEALIILYTFVIVLSLIAGTIKVMNNLYFSTDNTFLLTMPVSKEKLFISKILIIYIYELLKNYSYMLPLFIAFGIINGYTKGYFLYLVPALAVITLLIVVVSGLFSILAMQISIFMKRRLWVKTLCASVALVVAVVGLIKLISLLPDHFNFIESWSTIFWQINDFMKTYEKVAVPFTVITRFIIGWKTRNSIVIFNEMWFRYFLIIITVIVVISVVTFLLVRPLFFKMASTPFEFKKDTKSKVGENIKMPSFMSFLKKEVLLTIRTPGKINNIILVSVSMPVITFLINKIYNAMDTSVTGKNMVIMFNMLMIILLATTLSSMLTTSYSEEGGAAYLLKINPNKYIKSLFPKLIFNMFISTVSIIVSTIIFAYLRHIGVVDTILITLIIETVYLAHALWCADIDIMNPKTEDFARTGTSLNNGNDLKATLLSFALSIVVSVFTFVNLIDKSILNNADAYKKMFLAVLILLGIRIYMYITEIKLYFKEK